MKISQIFNLNKSQFELDFVDVDVSRDTQLFVDPYYISVRTDPWSVEASRTLHSFFQRIVSLLHAGDVKHAFSIFTNLSEPNETSLGMSKGMPSGRGAGEDNIKRIFDRLVKSRAVATGILEDLEDVRLFVPGVDKDKISDMATNIIRRHLIEYTQNQCNLWSIPLRSEVTSGPMWIRETNSWEHEHTEMLVIEERKILLVPKGVVSYANAYSGQEYHRHFVLNYLQAEHLRLDSLLVQRRVNKKGGERRWVTKKSIIETGARADKEYLADFTLRHPEVFADFKANAKRKTRPLTNEELGAEIADVNAILDHLIQRFGQIPTGNEHASEYHKTVVATMEILFYPRLTSPQVERRINSDRKRIDITFDNSADAGFFKIIQTKHDLPCPYIIIECKNYKKDLANPELDQLIGRFSPNRGKMGFAICRSFDSLETFMERCRDTFSDSRNLIIPLTDADMIAMLEEKRGGESEPGEALLLDKLRDIVLS
ncbi:hypothetical protein HNQ07_002563 [Deinococcus metalli]|uniref:Restriction endonuclease type IV Mrr domain-containing protein n=1 Tax=Deinococcus metalli TaxID=1141878 RepID=A0A7W8NQQ8_9DEIO|nr:hypothetical protein [Deinococcus metalli]MBB5377090.1 hypothetical protein [Deinococcus metalli]GHF49072.1 hypothetical protein GCM10017781_26850 [Deinococcus metalli]